MAVPTALRAVCSDIGLPDAHRAERRHQQAPGSEVVHQATSGYTHTETGEPPLQRKKMWKGFVHGNYAVEDG